MLKFFIAIAVSLVSNPAWADFTGECVSVTDGDTIKVMQGGVAERIRLARIDAPEHNQPFGQRAKLYCSQLCFGKTLTVEDRGHDRYGRTIGDITLPDGTNLNNELVKVGLAWWYRKYAPDDPILPALESQARSHRLGLWSDPSPIPPWEFRTQERAERRRMSPH